MNRTERTAFVIERTFKANPPRVWALWTTREGLEQWWGPEGFRSEVRHLELCIGGGFEIAMIAQVPQIIAYLKQAGLPAISVAKGRYTEIEPAHRLVYTNAVDFVPGVAPYTTTTVVEFNALPDGGTRLIVTNDAMHDAQWTEMARQGWTQQIDKLPQIAT